MSVRDLLANAAELRAEKRRMLAGSDTWSTRKINQIVHELGEVEIQIRELAVNEYEALLDLEAVGRSIIFDPEGTISPENIDRLNAALAAVDELRSQLSPENSKAAGTPAKSAPTASTEGA